MIACFNAREQNVSMFGKVVDHCPFCFRHVILVCIYSMLGFDRRKRQTLSDMIGGDNYIDDMDAGVAANEQTVIAFQLKRNLNDLKSLIALLLSPMIFCVNLSKTATAKIFMFNVLDFFSECNLLIS